MMIEAFVIGSIKVNVRRLGSDFVTSHSSNSESGVSSLLNVRASLLARGAGYSLPSEIRTAQASLWCVDYVTARSEVCMKVSGICMKVPQ